MTEVRINPIGIFLMKRKGFWKMAVCPYLNRPCGDFCAMVSEKIKDFDLGVRVHTARTCFGEIEIVEDER